MDKISVFECSVIDLGKINFPQGNLTVIENNSLFPFEVKRVFYLYDIADNLAKSTKNKNYTYKHLLDRLAIYNSEQFPFKVVNVSLEK